MLSVKPCGLHRSILKVHRPVLRNLMACSHRCTLHPLQVMATYGELKCQCLGPDQEAARCKGPAFLLPGGPVLSCTSRAGHTHVCAMAPARGSPWAAAILLVAEVRAAVKPSMEFLVGRSSFPRHTTLQVGDPAVVSSWHLTVPIPYESTLRVNHVGCAGFAV